MVHRLEMTIRPCNAEALHQLTLSYHSIVIRCKLERERFEETVRRFELDLQRLNTNIDLLIMKCDALTELNRILHQCFADLQRRLNTKE